MINNKTFDHRPINQLLAMVRGDLRRLDDEGLIDEGTVIKTIMWCNEKLGISLREVKERCVPVFDGKANLPKDFGQLYYACALPEVTTTMKEFKNPWDNSFDRDIIYEAEVDRAIIAGTSNYHVTIKKITNMEIKSYTKWVELELAPNSHHFAIGGSPLLNRKKKCDKITINKDMTISCPFKEGDLYLMYIGNMLDEEGNLLFPFHPLITPFYEWAIKEKILTDAVMNTEGAGYGELLAMAKRERGLAWLDAYNATFDRSVGEYINYQKKKELGWWNSYFKNFQ